MPFSDINSVFLLRLFLVCLFRMGGALLDIVELLTCVAACMEKLITVDSAGGKEVEDGLNP